MATFAWQEGYYKFGGIRLEDDVLVTETGARRVGKFHQFKKWSIKIFLASE